MDDHEPPQMPGEDQRNSGLILLMLLAQAYYNLLESTISMASWCSALDLELNESYLWIVKNITHLLKNHADLKDFPAPFEPLFPDLYPSTIRDIDWEDMVAPQAERFLSTVQQYVHSKGIYDPDHGSPAWIFLELFRPGVNTAIERAARYCRRAREYVQTITPQPTGLPEISAGKDIQAGGNIEASGSVQAGGGIKAGGNIRSGGSARPDARTSHARTDTATEQHDDDEKAHNPQGKTEAIRITNKAVQRTNVFISYSHKDARWRDELLTHLKPYIRTGSVTAWSDRELQPGSKWFVEIKAALTAARVAVLLVTPNFLASDFIHDEEFTPLLLEAIHGGVRILWIPVRDSSYHKSPLKSFQAVISPDKPLASMKAERDSAWVQICKVIESAVDAQSKG